MLVVGLGWADLQLYTFLGVERLNRLAVFEDDRPVVFPSDGQQESLTTSVVEIALIRTAA